MHTPFATCFTQVILLNLKSMFLVLLKLKGRLKKVETQAPAEQLDY